MEEETREEKGEYAMVFELNCLEFSHVVVGSHMEGL